jgi:hypothetical protein
MSICRIALLRTALESQKIFGPIYPIIAFICRRHTTEASKSRQSSSFPLLRTLDLRSLRPSRKTIIRTPIRTTEVNENILKSYQNLRSNDRQSVARLSVHELRSIAIEATKDKNIAVVDGLVADLLEIVKHRESWRVAVVLLRHHHQLLQPDRILALLSFFVPDPSKQSMDLNPFQAIADALLAHPETSASALKTLSEYFLFRLQDYVGPLGVRSIVYCPPPIIQSSFCLIRKLLHAKEIRCAAEIFQTLLKTNNLPREATEGSDPNLKDFPLIVLTVLVRAALHWDFRQEATEMAMALLAPQENSYPIQLATSVALDVISGLLDTPSRGDISACRHLMCELDQRAGDHFMIPGKLVRSFYSRARKLQSGDEAERFYAYTRSDSVVQKKEYQPPIGQSLLWLFTHLTKISRNRHLGRQLVNQVLTRSDLIPLSDRAKFIRAVSSQGYSTQTRALWEEYAAKKYRELIVGSPSAMLGVVGLFSKLIRKTQAKLNRLKEGGRSSSGRSSQTQGYFVLKRFASKEGSSIETLDDVDLNIDDIYRGDYEVLIDDLKLFTQCVIEEYRLTHEPLQKSHRVNLNALARAYFMVGNLHAGFKIFKNFLHRKQVPNLHDINVALGALASFDPDQAAFLIHEMIKRGLRPDLVTFGAVLHQAILLKKWSLVTSLVALTNQSIGGMPQKSLSSLIRASVDPDGLNKAELRLNLRDALKFMQSMKDGSYVRTVEMGKACIFSSLSVNDPTLAYTFWIFLVKDKAEWNADEQIFIRRLIARRIETHRRTRRLTAWRSSRMLSQLRQKTKLLSQ